MSASVNLALAPLVRKLQLWMPLAEADRAAVLALPHVVRRLRVNSLIVREGDRPVNSCLLLSGFAYRHKIAGNGGRQIFSIHMKGDIIDLHNSLLRTADHNVQALTDVEVALIPVEAIQEIAFGRPAVGKAMWLETLVDGSIFREWTLNVGRRDGLTRTAHLLCEFALRLKVAGLGEQDHYELPMTQEQLGDALALTAIHVNRMLKTLAGDGLISRTKRAVTIEDWTGLAQVGEFDSGYLHLSSDAQADI
jgi:CRP-like cAMP-binding protein